MATKKDIIPSVLNKIKQTFSKIQQAPSIQDNTGWMRQGKFTPLQQIGSQINYQKQTSPINRALYTALETAGRPVVNSLANIGALGTTGLGTAQMAFNKPAAAERSFDTALKLRKFAGTEGSFDQGTGLKTLKKGGLDAVQTALTGKGLKLLNPTNIALSGLIGGGASKISGGDFATGVGQGMGNTPQIMGFVGATNPLLSKFIPKAAGNVGGRVAGAGLNVLQGLGLDVARGTPTTAASVGLDVLTGLAGGKGQFETGGIKVKGFSMDKFTKDELVRAEDMLNNPTKYIKDTFNASLKNKGIEQKAQIKRIQEEAFDVIDRYAGKYLPNNVYTKSVGNPKQQIKLLIDLDGQNKLGNIQMGFAQEDRTKLKNVVDKSLDIGDPINPDIGKINQAIKSTDDIYNGLLKAPKDKDFLNKVKALRARYNEQLIKVAGADISSDYKTNYAAFQQVRGTNSPQVPLINKLEENIGKLDEIISNKGKISITQPIKTGGDVKPALIDRKVDLGFTPQKDNVPQTEKIKTTLSETGVLEPTTKGSQISQLSISKKGKLNTDKLNITPEQKVAIDQLQDNVPVTVIGNKDVVKQSRITTGAKKALTDDEMKNRLSQQLNTRQEVVSLTRQFDKLKQSGASEAELVALKSRIIDQSRIAQQEGTFAGRLLQARNILANEMATPEQKIYALLDNAGVDSKKYLKDAINVDFNNASETVNFYRKYVPAKFGEILDEIRYTNMLSSPLTQIVNTFSNVIQSGIVKPIEKTITGGLDFVSSKLTGKERQYFASQGIDYAKGYWKALPEAYSKFKKIASGAEVSLRPDLEFIPATTKGALKWYTTPLRTLEASDQFFRTLVESGERKSLSRFKMSDIELAKRAKESADYTLFRQKFDPTGELGQGVVLKTWDKWNSAIQHLRKVPGGNWILPFIQTPTNILKQGFEYSPLGFTTAIGAKRPLEQLSKAMIGTGAFLSLYGIADKGGTTWDTPSNAKDKELFYAAGLQPYSVKIGDKWVSYSKLGPLAYPLAMASALKWVEKNNPDQNVIENLQDTLGEMVGFFGDQSYVRSIGDVIDAIKGGSGNMLQNAISGEITNLTGQLVPYRSFQGWITRLIDPTYRKPEGVIQNIQAQTPGLSTGVPAYKDIYGEDSKRDLPLLNAFSPLKVSTEKPQANQLYRAQEQYRIGQQQEKKSKEDFEKGIGSVGEISKDKPIWYTADDGSVKKIDLAKITSLPEQTAYQKAVKEKQKYTLVDDIMNNLTGDDQINALKALGISAEDATYYNTAKQENYLKSIFVEEEIRSMANSGADKDQILNYLSTLRKSVNEKILLADGVITDLVDKNIISYQDGKNLKNVGKDLKPKSLKAKKGKKISVSKGKVSAKKYTSSKSKFKVRKGTKFKAPKYITANFTTPKKLL